MQAYAMPVPHSGFEVFNTEGLPMKRKVRSGRHETPNLRHLDWTIENPGRSRRDRLMQSTREVLEKTRYVVNNSPMCGRAFKLMLHLRNELGFDLSDVREVDREHVEALLAFLESWDGDAACRYIRALRLLVWKIGKKELAWELDARVKQIEQSLRYDNHL
jgi:hypothetical protein